VKVVQVIQERYVSFFFICVYVSAGQLQLTGGHTINSGPAFG